MKLVNPTIKYKDSYLNLVKNAKENGDISEMENVYLLLIILQLY